MTLTHILPLAAAKKLICWSLVPSIKSVYVAECPAGYVISHPFPPSVSKVEHRCTPGSGSKPVRGGETDDTAGAQVTGTCSLLEVLHCVGEWAVDYKINLCT